MLDNRLSLLTQYYCRSATKRVTDGQAARIDGTALCIAVLWMCVKNVRFIPTNEV